MNFGILTNFLNRLFKEIYKILKTLKDKNIVVVASNLSKVLAKLIICARCSSSILSLQANKK